MSRVYHSHDMWEDHRHGMYATRYTQWETGTRLAAALLSDPDGCWAAMSAVVREWPYSTEHNLTDPGQNRRAWLGQAACCFELGVPASVTGAGWWLMHGRQRAAANDTADRVIKEWEDSRGQQSMFS